VSERPDRCPSCSGTLAAPRPASCPWCGGALAAIPAPAPPSAAPTPSRHGDARDLPRELPPLQQPARSGCLVLGLVLAVLFAGAIVVLSVNRVSPSDAPPPSAPKSR